MTGSTQKPLRRPDVEVSEVGPGHVLVDRASGDAHVINDTALALWELCDGRTARAEMVDAICELFSAPRDRVDGDVRATLDEFERLGLLARSVVDEDDRHA